MPKLPEEAPSIFDYNVNPHTGKWFHWDTMIKVSEIIPFCSFLVLHYITT